MRATLALMAEGPRRVRRLCGGGGGGGAGLRFNAQVRHKKSSLPRGPFDNDTAADFADDLDDAAAEERENLIRGVGLPPERCPQAAPSRFGDRERSRTSCVRRVRRPSAVSPTARGGVSSGDGPSGAAALRPPSDGRGGRPDRRPRAGALPQAAPGPVGRRSTKTGAGNVNRSATDQDTDRAGGRTSRPPRISCGCAGSRSDRPTPRCSAGPPPHP
ncbi:DUF4259 domain-containing protein [Streptomyces sp. NPDC004096]